MKKQTVNYDYNDFINQHDLEYRVGPNLDGEWLWPREDSLCWEFFNKHEYKAWAHLNIPKYQFPDEVIKLLSTKKRKLVLQAGGNCGLYAKLYSAMFERVVTFEPDHRWFICLNHNASEKNIFKLQVALGNNNIPVSMIAPTLNGKENLGALYVTTDNGLIPKITIDSLGLDPDLIHLDIEGAEWDALLGAADTIKRSKPIIVVEWNQSGQRFGWSDEKIENMFLDLDYILLKEWSRDRAYAHKDSIHVAK